MSQSLLGEPLQIDPMRIAADTVEALTWSESQTDTVIDVTTRGVSMEKQAANASAPDVSLASALETMDAELNFFARQSISPKIRRETDEAQTTTVTETVRKRKVTTTVREEFLQKPDAKEFFGTNIVFRKDPVETMSLNQAVKVAPAKSAVKSLSPLRSTSGEKPSLELDGLRLEIVEVESKAIPEKIEPQEEVRHTLKIFEESSKTVSMPRPEISLPIEAVAIRNDIATKTESAPETELVVLQMMETVTVTRTEQHENVEETIAMRVGEEIESEDIVAVETVLEVETEEETVAEDAVEAVVESTEETAETNEPISINVIRLNFSPARKRIGPFIPRKFVIELRTKSEPVAMPETAVAREIPLPVERENDPTVVCTENVVEVRETEYETLVETVAETPVEVMPETVVETPFRSDLIEYWENHETASSEIEVRKPTVASKLVISKIAEPETVTVVEETVVVEESIVVEKTVVVEERETTSTLTIDMAEKIVEEPAPILFPALETACMEEIKESGESKPTDQPVWRLHWHPVWPKYLASLEYRASNQIRHLADHLEMQLANGRKVVSFHGFRSGDGSTTLSLCAARELAERGHRLLLADAHPQYPELAMLLELDVHPHLYEIMTLIPDRLELLPWSESFIETVSHDQTHMTSFADIVASLRDEYDGILLDSGSLTESPLKKYVGQWRQMRSDGVLLVVNTKNPEPINVRAVAQRLHQFNVELLGVAENYV